MPLTKLGEFLRRPIDIADFAKLPGLPSLGRIPKLLIFAWFGFLFLSSQFIVPARGWKEFFPFFHWSLFSGPPASRHDFVIRMLEWEGQVLASPCSLAECKLPLKPEVQSSAFYFLVQNFGATVLAGSDGREDLKAQIDQQAFSSKVSCKYALASRSVDPVAFVWNHDPGQIENLAFFAKGAPGE